MENLTNWCVYMHENRVNGKKYIGITSQKPTNRWQNGGGYRQNEHFTAAIQKYGWDAFRHEILYTGLTQVEAEALEVKLIAKYGTLNRELGYNKAPGGSAPSPTEETREKLREAHKGQKPTVFNRQRIIEAVKGKPQTEAHRQKISKAKDGRPIRCVETGIIYLNPYDASRKTGLDHSSLRRCCLGQLPKTVGGFHWEYIEAVGCE